MKMMYVVGEDGKIVKNMTSDESHPRSIHECWNCVTDIDETFDEGCLAYPVPANYTTSTYHGEDVSNGRLLCHNCYMEYIVKQNIDYQI